MACLYRNSSGFQVPFQQSHSALNFSKEKCVGRIMLLDLSPSEPKLGLVLKRFYFFMSLESH